MRDNTRLDNTSLNDLDRLIADAGGDGGLGTQTQSRHALLLEHLRSARTSLIGSMPGEYQSSLKEAKVSAACIADKSAQRDIKNRLQALMRN